MLTNSIHNSQMFDLSEMNSVWFLAFCMKKKKKFWEGLAVHALLHSVASYMSSLSIQKHNKLNIHPFFYINTSSQSQGHGGQLAPIPAALG